MEIIGEPRQWRVKLRDGSNVGLWASAQGESDGYYTFEIFVSASAAEQSDEELVISARTPANPNRVLITVARIPVAAVKDIVTGGWETPGEGSTAPPA